MADTYICETSYHVLITLIKVLINKDRDYKLILLTGETLNKDIVKRLNDSGLFQSVTRIDGLHQYDKMLDYSAPILIRGRSLRKQIDRFVKWDYDSLDDYYLYNDVSMLGKWFNAHKIKYHLIEDGLDTFTLPTVHSNNYPESKWRKRFRQFFNAGFYCFGESRFTSSIEVNSKKGLQFDIKGKNIIEVPRKELFSKLSNSAKKKILSIYLSEDEIGEITDKLKSSAVASLLLTQPLGFDKMTSYEMQEEFYRDIISQYATGQLIIKPHPRDDFDYNIIEPKAVIIRYPFLPVEVLGFLPGVSIGTAITWCSTSINGIDFCKNKVYLGIEFIAPYLKRDNFDSQWHMASAFK